MGKEVVFCRDRPGEDVRDLVIVSTNTGTAPLGAFTHTLRVAPTCPFPNILDFCLAFFPVFLTGAGVSC